MGDALSFIQFIGKIWDRRIGLFSSLILLFGLYLLLNDFSFIPITIYIFLNIAVIIFWLLSTRRFFFRHNSQIVLAIHVSTDEIDVDYRLVDYRIKKIVKKTIRDIYSEFDRKKVRIYLLPLNYISDEKKMKKFLEFRHSMLDTFIDIKIDSGNFDNVGKMFITQMKSYAYLDGSRKEKKLFFDSIEFQQDLSIINYHKNWDLIYTNDGNDKIKLKENLKESILHYCAIFALYGDNYELSKEFLSSIFKPESRQLEKPKLINGKIQPLKITPENRAAGRLATILANVYLAIAVKNSSENKKKEALIVLLECDKLGTNKHTYALYIGIARISFELKKIDLSIEYNNKAKTLLPHGREVLMNEVWFAAIRNDISKFCQFQNKLVMKGIVKGQNYIDILIFIDTHRSSFPLSNFLFDFLEGYYNYAAVDKQLGLQTLVNLQNKISGNSDYLLLDKLIERILSKKPQKKGSNSTKKKKKKKKRKKR